MSNGGGLWNLYLIVWGVGQSQWPTVHWGPCASIPTPEERGRALATLGYEAAPGFEWQWCEGDPAPDSTERPVRLIASIDVQPIGGEQA
jgi:hypothetical protein